MKRAIRVLLVALAACGASGDVGSENESNLPSAGVGPFRALTADEVRGTAPFVLDDPKARYREPAILRDGAATLLYAVAHRTTPREVDVIVRTVAFDERSFFGGSGDFGRTLPVVVEPDALWEGDALSGPTLVRARGEVLLYYSGREGIGLARSADGRSFAKAPGPILARDPVPGSWETSAPRAPSVFTLPDGRLRMLYAAGSAIGEAESTDGVTWRRRGPGPILAPRPPEPLAPNERPAFDGAAVGDPCVVTRTTPAGRWHMRVLYTGTDETGATAIGFAGRYSEDGPLDRQPLPVFSVGRHEAAPALLDLGDVSFLYVQEERNDVTVPYLGIGAAVAPTTVKLPPPAEFPSGP